RLGARLDAGPRHAAEVRRAVLDALDGRVVDDAAAPRDELDGVLASTVVADVAVFVGAHLRHDVDALVAGVVLAHAGARLKRQVLVALVTSDGLDALLVKHVALLDMLAGLKVGLTALARRQD